MISSKTKAYGPKLVFGDRIDLGHRVVSDSVRRSSAALVISERSRPVLTLG